jgi:hypothetical protein
VLAGELAEEGGEERDDDGGDGVATEDRVPLLDIAAEQLLHEHLLRLHGFSRSYPSRRRHRLTVWAGFRADVGVPTRALRVREKTGRRENTAGYGAVEAGSFFPQVMRELLDEATVYFLPNIPLRDVAEDVTKTALIDDNAGKYSPTL